MKHTKHNEKTIRKVLKHCISAKDINVFSKKELKHIVNNYYNVHILTNLPDNIIIDIALQLEPKTIGTYCLLSKKFNNLICNNEYFWMLKVKKDLGTEKKKETWKESYQTVIINVTKLFNRYGKTYTPLDVVPVVNDWSFTHINQTGYNLMIFVMFNNTFPMYNLIAYDPIKNLILYTHAYSAPIYIAKLGTRSTVQPGLSLDQVQKLGLVRDGYFINY